ncbi:MAG: terminase small subunit [Acetobacteraceae bacterium]|nr:terminase small subunit [Acetobacteraceae bacterium]
MTTLVNQRELAQVLGVSLPTLRDMVRRHAGFPVESRGDRGVEWKFDPDRVKAFLAAMKAEEAAAEAARHEKLAQMALPLGSTATPGAVSAQQLAQALAEVERQLLELPAVIGARHGLEAHAVEDVRRLLVEAWKSGRAALLGAS